MFNKLLLISLVGVLLNGCAGYGNNQYNAEKVLPLTAKVGIISNTVAEGAIAEGMISGANDVGAKNVKMVIGDYAFADDNFEYIVRFQNAATKCTPSSAGVAGAVITGATTALLPVGIGSAPTSYSQVTLATFDKQGNKVGQGWLRREGSTLLVNCEKQLKTIGQGWAERQFGR